MNFLEAEFLGPDPSRWLLAGDEQSIIGIFVQKYIRLHAPGKINALKTLLFKAARRNLGQDTHLELLSALVKVSRGSHLTSMMRAAKLLSASITPFELKWSVSKTGIARVFSG